MTAREQMQQRCFSQKQRETILQTLRHALRVKSDADLPKVFQLPVAVALKPGSWEELAARFNVPRDESGVNLGRGRNRTLSLLESHFAPDVLADEQNMLPSKR